MTTAASPTRRERTLRQNAFYWAAVIPTAVEGLSALAGIPLSPDSIHKGFRARFLTVDNIDPETGELLDGTRVRSTTELTTREFNVYLDQIAVFLSERNIPFPTPE